LAFLVRHFAVDAQMHTALLQGIAECVGPFTRHCQRNTHCDGVRSITVLTVAILQGQLEPHRIPDDNCCCITSLPLASLLGQPSCGPKRTPTCRQGVAIGTTRYRRGSKREWSELRSQLI
jgi:hypothetical protein